MECKPEVIAEISTSDLIDELTRRCKPAVFIGTKEEGGDDGGKNTFWASEGDPDCCAALCRQLEIKITRDKTVKDIKAMMEDPGI